MRAPGSLLAAQVNGNLADFIFGWLYVEEFAESNVFETDKR
jgi:hypothetical protein